MPEGAPPPSEVVRDDAIRPFILERPALRGRLVRLGPVVDEILTRHSYPEPIAGLLGEMLALAAALSSMLKFDGIFTLQTKGDGPVGMMVADITTAGELRGYADYNREVMELLEATQGGRRLTAADLIGAGYLAYTVDQGAHTERYQGIVELSGASLADCIHHYFRQSEQLKSAVVVAAGRPEGAWRASAIFLQQMPPDDAGRVFRSEREAGEHWFRAQALLSTCRPEELLDPELGADDLLYRLFHEEQVRVFRQRPLGLGCRCSRARLERILGSMPADDIAEMIVEGEVVMTCQFCNIDFRFDEAALAKIHES